MRTRWLLVSLTALLCGCSSSPSPAIHTPTQSFRDVSPRWSPDGKRIAFFRVFDGRRTQLWVTGADLRNPRAVSEIDPVPWGRRPILGRTSSIVPDAPAWSPDGRRLVVSRAEQVPFENRRIGGTALWIYDVDSGKRTPIATHPPGYDGDLQFYRAPAWSPDGKRIAYMAEGVFGYASLVIHTLGVTRPDEQSPFVDMLDDNGWPAWSPDGKWLAYRHSLYQSESAIPVEVIRLVAPGSSRTRTIVIKSREPQALWRTSHLAWSPDAPLLAARVYASGKPETAWMNVFDIRTGFAPIQSLPGAPKVEAIIWTGSNATLKPDLSYVQPDLLRHGFRWLRQLITLHKANSGFRLSGSRFSWEGFQCETDDFDISPDGERLVVSTSPKRQPAAPTMLLVVPRPTPSLNRWWK